MGCVRKRIVGRLQSRVGREQGRRRSPSFLRATGQSAGNEWTLAGFSHTQERGAWRTCCEDPVGVLIHVSWGSQVKSSSVSIQLGVSHPLWEMRKLEAQKPRRSRGRSEITLDRPARVASVWQVCLGLRFFLNRILNLDSILKVWGKAGPVCKVLSWFGGSIPPKKQEGENAPPKPQRYAA